MIHTTDSVSDPCLVALDWGTTSLRAWLLGGDGRTLASRRHTRGLLSTAASGAERAAGHQQVFDEVCGDWLRAAPHVASIACGMVGSDQGWRDAGYRTVPAGLNLDRSDLTAVEHDLGVLHLVPGLRVAAQDGTPGDVMRGEETQLIGVLDSLPSPNGRHTVVLPGTHTKWVRLEGGEVVSFTTAMSGDLYALVLQHGILALTAARHGPPDDGAFLRGLTTSVGSRGLAAELFGARALVLDGLLEPQSLPDYVSGVIIGDEVEHQLPRHRDAERIVLCGTSDLCRRYAVALDRFNIVATPAPEDATARGLWKVAVRTGLIETMSSREEGSARQ